ncbi:hypothetical protein H6F93_06760 [Leptolyngbya sp. FACHB-671]|uniref:hypothetical protein n=1 Tax=Leptolyngbya sp. FACHB-671 TaxID=2692812 RepID=UPI001685A3ED|nr:hypothetical protein [Leptolyngbya sp. FACHB-671]MBD2067228.1 hypothetical protein [Leptolyngbya sp. FACHB-671]
MGLVDLEAPFSAIQESQNLTYKVFRVFSRFEFALKRSGFVTQQRKQLRIEWRCFAQKHVASPLPKPLSSELMYFIEAENRPKKQKLENGCLCWEIINSPPEPITLEWLLEAAYTVRNNLFHGGKWTSAIEEPARDEKLLRASLAVIKIAIEMDQDVQFHYTDSI